MNKLFIIGRIANNPESKVSAQGNSICIFSIATNDNVNKKTTHFFHCVAFKNEAQFIEKYLGKGDLVVIDGSVRNNTYISKKTNSTVTTTEIVVDRINLISKKGSSQANSDQQNMKSIVDEFKTSIVNNDSGNNEHKQVINQNIDNSDEDIEWVDENDK